jgi:hypothetical protein
VIPGTGKTPSLAAIVKSVRDLYDAKLAAAHKLHSRANDIYAEHGYTLVGDSIKLQAEAEDTVAAQFGNILHDLENLAAYEASVPRVAPPDKVVRLPDGGVFAISLDLNDVERLTEFYGLNP